MSHSKHKNDDLDTQNAASATTSVVESYVEDVMNGIVPKPKKVIITKHDAKVCGRKNTKYISFLIIPNFP